MSTTFYWFKDIKVKQISEGGRFWDGECEVEMVDGHSTSHSSGNISPIQKALLNITNDEIDIPYIPIGKIDGEVDNLESNIKEVLISPNKMTLLLSEILSKNTEEISELIDRVRWMKEISKDGYYIAYESF